MRAAHDAGDPIAMMAADRAFHAAVVDAAGNRILADLYHRLRDRQMRMGVTAFRLSPDRMGQALEEHRALLAALRAGDDDRAGDAGGDDPGGDDAGGAAAARWTALVGAHIDTAATHLRGLR
jgi:DNA-binding GntR family transcriptional regulator